MMRFTLFVFSLLVVIVSGQYVTVQTDNGAVRGFLNENVQTFFGIPFAAPPVGNLRLKAPQPHPTWGNAILDTTQQKPSCPQTRITDWLYTGQEDCLYLDVYAPANMTKPLPVLVWFYGGGYIEGDSRKNGEYDGTNLVNNHNYIFVAPNYRLGPLGFLALDELKAEDPDQSTGNYGVQDQVRALQWVQKNIAAFGGDPDHVVIQGESAGAFSVCWHLANERSNGLFKAAILESGTCDAPQFFVPYEKSKAWSQDYVTAVGCNAQNSTGLLDCIRELPAGHILGSLLGVDTLRKSSNCPQLYPLMPWGPTIDMSPAGLKDVPINLMKKGDWNKVNVMMGTNHNEGSIFVPAMALIIPGTWLPLQLNQLNQTLGHFYNQNMTIVNQIMEEYPVSEYQDVDDMASQVLRDYFFVCAARRTLKILSTQGVNTWLYHFTYKGDWIEDPILGDYHGAEIQFVFDVAYPPIIHIFSQRDQAMSDVMTQYWSNFIHTYDPNGDGTYPVPNGMKWPTYETVDLINMVMDDPPVVQEDLLEGKCHFGIKLYQNHGKLHGFFNFWGSVFVFGSFIV